MRIGNTKLPRDLNECVNVDWCLILIQGILLGLAPGPG